MITQEMISKHRDRSNSWAQIDIATKLKTNLRIKNCLWGKVRASEFYIVIPAKKGGTERGKS